jgi:hypothetical protein
MFLLCIGFVIRYASSWNGRNVILGVAYALMFWDGFLKNYIEDRKYIPRSIETWVGHIYSTSL